MNLDDIARDQGGPVRRGQLLAAGWTEPTIDSWRHSGRLLTTAYDGVYRVDGAPLDEHALTWAAVLGTRSVLSYLTAAQFWDLPTPRDNRIHITRPDRKHLDHRRGLRIHRTRLDADVVTTHKGLPMTNRPETVMDCVGWLAPRDAPALLDRAFQQHWLHPRDVQRRLADQPRRWGNRRLDRLLRDSMPGAEAESERRVHRILRQAGIAGWTGNLPIVLDGERFRIDIEFPAPRIAVEIEGWAFHRSIERRNRDLARLNALTRNGWRLIVLNYAHTLDPAYVLGQLGVLLAAS